MVGTAQERLCPPCTLVGFVAAFGCRLAVRADPPGAALSTCASSTDVGTAPRRKMLSRMPKAPAKPARSVLDCIEHGATILPYKDVPLDQG
ncbi:hypothetical protein DAA51_07240 [Bradyrhizobium sp. WBAH10]|nr:hypothetical protein DAA51_07240 [Bradyrhizobium sp. WBAH10]QCJ81151.1 hypothetical protein DAA53_08280 [Bradyrhizobium sp. WBAH23]QCJ88520.1 hypothetical protein DAA57_08360 [Bradyrhizobium yuanmingense]QCJ95884.1 hypothetical protein DAA61_08240 [Bradyrhizobium sp. WBAH33]